MNEVGPGQWHSAVHRVEAALVTSAGFRAESDSQPLVYGYLRPRHTRPNELAICRRALGRYCDREQLRLCTVFVDPGVGDTQVTRPGLTGLCDVLRLPDSFAAVLVSVKHLSANARVAHLLAQRIRGTGARLLFVRAEATTATAGAANGPYTQLPQWWQ